MAYALFVDSANSIEIAPERSMSRTDKPIDVAGKTWAGVLMRTRYGTRSSYKVPVEYVPASVAALVNSWWEGGQALLFMEVGASEVYSVMITNKDQPITDPNTPYDDQFKGVLELETY